MRCIMKLNKEYESENQKFWPILVLLLPLTLSFLLKERLYFVLDEGAYLSFHITLESLSILISAFIAIQGWLIFPYNMSRRRLLLSILFLMVGLLDFMHMVSYKGMPTFITDSSVAKATWFWIFARFTEAIGMFFIFLFPNKNYVRHKRFLLYIGSFITALFFSFFILYYERYFPILVVKGVGVTPLKRNLEYLISFIHLITIVMLVYQNQKEKIKINQATMIALTFILVSELIFTLYKNVFDIDNLIGHFYKIFGYYYLMKGIYITTIEEPFIQKEKLEKESYRKSTTLLWVLEKIKEGFIFIDKDLKVRIANPIAKEHFNMSNMSDHIEDDFWKILQNMNIKEEECHIYRALINGTELNKEKVLYNNRIFLVDILSIYDPTTSELEGVACFFEDITEKESENKRKEELMLNYLHNAQNLQQLLDSIPISFLAINRDHKVIALNEEFLKYQPGLTKETVIGMSINEALIGISESELELTEVFNGKRVEKIEVLPGGTCFIISHPIICHRENKIIGAVISIQDITEVEHLRGEILRLDRLNTVGQMAASITHEIRNPITAVKGFLQLTSEKIKDFNPAYFEIITKELDRINDIISDFLSLSQNRIIKKTVGNLNKVITDIIPIIQAEANMKGHIVNVELEEIPEFPFNEKEIKQLILNLSRNAIEAMECEGILTIKTSISSGEIQLIVQDTGKGIPEEDRNRLFEPFYTTKEGGTGLGLIACKNIVEKHEGRMEIKSKVGTGTRIISIFSLSKIVNNHEETLLQA